MRHIRLTMAVVAAGLIVGVAAASAASAARATKVTCKLALTQQINSGETAIDPADTSGTQAGGARCGKAVGQGIITMAFTVQDSGNMTGPWKAYFDAGTVHGRFVLVPSDDNPTTLTSFSQATYAGTVTVAGGTGADVGARGKGTVICETNDGVHTACVEHLRLTAL